MEYGGINNMDEFDFYSKEEIKELLKNERLVYADDGINEVVIRYKDIPDFIVDYNNRNGLTDLKFYAFDGYTVKPIITTLGYFLNRCDPKVREDIIERLVDLQTGDKIKNYKIIDEYDLEEVRNEISLKI